MIRFSCSSLVVRSCDFAFVFILYDIARALALAILRMRIEVRGIRARNNLICRRARAAHWARARMQDHKSVFFARAREGDLQTVIERSRQADGGFRPGFYCNKQAKDLW